LRPVQSWRLAHHGDRHQGAFCALMARANHSRAALLRLQQEVCEGANGVPCTKSYPFGIIETAVRVKVDGKIVANLLTGQILLHPPTRQQIRLVVRQIRAWQLGKNAEQAIHLYRSTRVMPRHEYLACVKLLEFFAEQLGTIANQILLQQQTAEPVQITRARQFIEQHYFEKIDLAEISRQAGMCTFYFSKRFKEVTGLNFTGYVSRLRVEKAKQLLLNHHFRVSEIGFEIGFQSLTHFNRQFKKIAGCSPTEYRCHLPTV
jgi:AraC-like DNA-binding protein